MGKSRLFAAGLLLAFVLSLTGCVTPPPGETTASTVPPGTSESTDPIAPTTTLIATEPSVPPTTEPSVPPTTVPPATEPYVPPTTVPPATEPSVPPTTVPPATEPSVPPTTVPPATEPYGPPTTVPPTTEPSVPPTTQPTVPPTTAPLSQGGIPQKVTVEASGVLVESKGGAVIDYSNTKDGYVMVRYTQPSEKRLKVQVKGATTTYTYDLTPEKWAAFPLSDENGTYKITVLRNTTGSKYALLLSLTVDVQMTDEFAPFLRSNQYVDFDAAPKATAKAAQLTWGVEEPLKKVEKIYNFVVGSLTYDKDLAANVKSGYLPVLDRVLEKQKGICFDYAALMTGMLRSQGVPTKLVVGYAGEAYHAWISVWSETDGWVDGVIYFDGTSWQRMDPTFASSGGGSSDIMNYIGNGSNYTPKYFY